MVVFLVGLALLWPVLMTRSLSGFWLLAPAVAFLAAAIGHDRLIRRRESHERATRYHQAGLDRLDDRWAGRGSAGGRFLDADHPYAADLDLFGEGSLFELLSVARTRAGEQRLACWLCAPATGEEIQRRQEAVRELAARVDLREELAVVGEAVKQDDDPEGLAGWAASAPVLKGTGPAWVAVGLALGNLTTLVGWIASPSARWAFFVAVSASLVFTLAYLPRTRKVLGQVGRREHELRLLSGLLARLESEQFDAAMLVELRETLATRGRSPSRTIARLARLLEIRDSCRNMIFAPVAALLLLPAQTALALERWRVRHGAAVARWIDAVGQIEALASLATVAHERPDDAYPEIVDDGPCYDGSGLGHPLLPDARCVRNDVRLDSRLRLLIVSGSNMSGKSTLLRTLGINAVLAFAGAPVRARRLRLSPLAVGACMRVVDSLQEGTSHFYAEITRLSRIVALAGGERTLLFLLDEILHGTNSHDRRIGAAGVIRALLERGALGLVTTHDLALAKIADDLGAQAENVHFEDRIERGKIVFDYRLRPGVVERSNALDLMRAVGLEV